MLTIGDRAFDEGTRRVCGPSGEQRLSPKAAAVLSALAETPGRVWSRDALLERVWPNVTVTEEVLTHAIAELRRVLGDDFRNPSIIETIHKSGYRLLVHVESSGAQIEESAWPHGEPETQLDCYGAYLEASALFDRGHKTNTQRAAKKFNEILAVAPDFALAHVGIAKAMTFLQTYYEPADGLDEALVHCRTAKRLDPLLPDAYAVEGLIHAIGGRFDRSRREFSRALQLQRDHPETHYLFGRACFAELNIELAAPMLERAAALRPDDYHSLMLAGKARQMLGHEESAKRNFALTASRTRPYIEAFPADTRALCAEARSLFQIGERDAARAALEKALDSHEPCFHMACTFARAGETDGALDLLEQVVDAGWKHSRWLDRDPDFQPYRHHPRFQRIARSIPA